jgi:myosin heavy subunit
MATKMEEINKFVFVKDPYQAYKAVEVASIDHAKGEIEIIEIGNSNAKLGIVKLADTNPIASLDELYNPPPDLIKLMMVNLPGILNALRHRFERDFIYTSVGPILVALNPFKWVKGIYDESVMMQYFHEEIDLSSDPHVRVISFNLIGSYHFDISN